MANTPPSILARQAKQKQDIIAYYTEMPIYKYAANAVGIDEDTLLIWRKADKEFSDNLKRAKSEFVRKHGRRVKSEWILEKVDREIFGDNKTLTLNVADPVETLLNKFELKGGEDAGQAQTTEEATPQSSS